MSVAPRLPTIAAYPLPEEAELPPVSVGWTIAPARAALLVHDMQAYFAAAFVAGESPIAPVVENIRQLATACRRAGMPVFYTAQNGDQPPHDRGLQQDFWGPGMRDAPEHQQIVAPLAPEAGDIVLVKHRYSAFQRSNFAELLRARGRDQLLICGVYAHIGCLFTAADAFQHDIEPFMAADALADFSRRWHDAALAQAANCCARVLSTRQMIEALT